MALFSINAPTKTEHKIVRIQYRTQTITDINEDRIRQESLKHKNTVESFKVIRSTGKVISGKRYFLL